MSIRNNLPVELPELPDMSANPEEILNRLTTQYEAAYLEQNGTAITLSSGDPIRIWLYTISLNQYLLENLVKYYASMNFLAYSQGTFIDHISATRGGPVRNMETAAVVTMRFFFSAPLTKTETIPAGTRVTPDGNLFFFVDEPYAVPVGAEQWEQVFTCQAAGVIGNGYLPGQISTLVDPLPYVQSVSNIDTSQGGADVEDDQHYAERVFLSPEGYAVAGPELAYEYIARSFSPAIDDVKAYMPEAGNVNVVVTLQDGEMPDQAFLSELLEFISAKDRRPLTDYVHTMGPETVSYDIAFTYYIPSAQASRQAEIQAAVESAVLEYIEWQKAQMGRDINPQELISLARAAGAKRLEIISPEYTVVGPYGIAVAGDTSVTFGGLEDE